MMACLNSAGKLPVVNDLLHNKVTNGESKQLTSFTSHVGAGSRWHVLFGAELINFWISSTVTAVTVSFLGSQYLVANTEPKAVWHTPSVV